MVSPYGLGFSLLCFSFGCANATDASSSSEEGPAESMATNTATQGNAERPESATGVGAAAAAPTNDPTGDDDAPAAGAARPASRPDPGPKPAACSVSKDGDGFFWRSSSKSSYVAYVPASYTGDAPMRLVVGLHGCSDEPMNFARWGINPFDGRKTQNHIGLSVGGETGNNKCWSMGKDDAKVLAAVEDIAKCFWVDRAKVVIAGYSSGGQLAYRVGLSNPDAFAGIIIENSALYAAGLPAATLLSTARGNKLPIAHRAHTSDSVFPIAKVKADWATIARAGNPLKTSEVAGGHDGSSADWLWLHAQSAGWSL